MLQVHRQTTTPTSRINAFIIGALSTSLLVLVGIMSYAPYASF
jgi:hypothetical protein